MCSSVVLTRASDSWSEKLLNLQPDMQRTQQLAGQLRKLLYPQSG